jgi:branched-chain amino acid transport system substrate-binding protein
MKLDRLLAAVLMSCASCASGQQKPDDPQGHPTAQAGAPASSEDADEARFKAAQALSKSGKLLEAQAALSEILEKYPTSRFKQQAAVELGLVQARLGKKADAEQTLQAAAASMSEADKKKAEAQLAEALAQGGAEGVDALAAARALESAPEAERAQKLAPYLERLDAAPAPVLVKLAADLDHKSPAWPAAALKLSLVQIHLGDRTHALQMLEEVVAQGGGTPVQDKARALRDELKKTSSVNPKLVGIVLPLTGKFKAFAESMLDAISLQIDLQNRGPLQVMIKDSRNEPEGAQQAVEDLAREGAIAILGPIGLAEGTAAAVRAQQLGVPIISLARAEGLTALGPYVFREMTTSSQQARAVAKYAAEKLGAKTFALLQPESPGGEDLGRFFWDAVDAGSGEMRGYEHYPDRATNFKKTIQRLVGRDNLADRKEFVEEEARIAAEITDPYRRRKALAQLRSSASPIIDFDALFIPDFASAVRLLAPALASEDIVTNGCDVKDLEVVKKTTKREDLRAVQLLGWMGWDSAELVDERLGAARYVQCSIFVDGFFNRSQRPATARFVEIFESTFHRLPLLLEAHAHDAAGILKAVIQSRAPHSRDDLRDALSSMQKPFEGAAGDTVFGKDREADKALFWLWINKGNITEFDPAGQPPVPLVPSAQAALDAEKAKGK